MEDDSSVEQKEVVDAKEIYLLMKDEYRISRNTRASWYLKNLNTNLTFRQKTLLSVETGCDEHATIYSEEKESDSNKIQDDFTEELDILSIIPCCGPSTCYQAGSHGNQDSVHDNSHGRPERVYRLTPDTKVVFLARQYRLVFVLDISPSIASVDFQSSSVLYEDVFLHLQTAIRAVIKPFYPTGSKVLYRPQIYVTIIAHTPLMNCKASQVLIQGCILTDDNVDSVLENIRRELDSFENQVASALAAILDQHEADEEEEQLTGGLFEDIVERSQSPDPSLYLMSPDASFTNMLRYGILSLQLLPENSSASIIVITDGIVGLPDASLFESLMMQLRHSTVACSFMQIRAGYHIKSGLAVVAYPELMQFIATATFGAYFSKLPDLADCSSSEEMNVFHQAFLTWSFQRALECFKIDDFNLATTEDISNDLVWTYKLPWFSRSERDLWTTPMFRRKLTERNVHTPISILISCRLREGYTIKNVNITKGESQIEVKLVLPWRYNVRIEYQATSAWPLNNAKRNTHVEVYIESSYDFLQDVTTPLKKPFKSPYRTAVVKKYWQTIQGMSETDQLLVHLQSFSSNPVYYQVPEGLMQGVPLFYLPPGANMAKATINSQLGTKDTVLNQFALFWKPVLMLDVNIWQKWMHTHRIGLVLEHDTPLGKHLHIPNSSGRFHQVTCRQALTSLSFFLRDWSTFVLMENHSYIKLLFSDPDKPPTSFYVLRMASKPPCMVLRLAFLGGTSGKQRNEIVTQLRESLVNLNFPHRGTQKEDKAKKMPRRKSRQELAAELTEGEAHTPPLQRQWSEIPCCVSSQKPIEKILIRYERMPRDISTLEMPPILDQSGHLTHIVSANKAASSVYTTLSRYLSHQRWIWSVQHGNSIPISMAAIGRILTNLTKIRLQEKFNFAHTNSGIVNMVAELEMRSPNSEEPEDCEGGETFPGVMQYVIFPPHTTTTRESISSEDLALETVEADGELKIITECWVEPQYGNVVNSTPERKHFDGLDYKQLTLANRKDLET